MSRWTLKIAAVIVLGALFTIPAYPYLIAQEPASSNDAQSLFDGDYMISLTTGTADAKLVSKAELREIGGKPFLKCTLIDADVLKEEYRGTTCYVSVDQIVSIQELPSKK